jgi:AcrR family transcriptional regulator
LFAEYGFAGVSLRAIIADAKVNLAAIHIITTQKKRCSTP